MNFVVFLSPTKYRVGPSKKVQNMSFAPLFGLRSSIIVHMRGVGALSENMCGNNFCVHVGGRYQKVNLSCNVSV